MEDTSAELESFRKQWREEVIARTTTTGKGKQRQQIVSGAGSSSSSKKTRTKSTSIPLPYSSTIKNEDEDGSGPEGYDNIEEKNQMQEGQTSSSTSPLAKSKEPQTALEHYEKAVEREAQGQLGDSLNFYRKAFRLDDRVDRAYKNKHFPPTAVSKPTNLNPSNAPATVPNTAHHSLYGPDPSLSALIGSFSGLAIESVPPPTEASPPPPCPISTIPTEILVHILEQLAITDVASFVRLAQVCKRFAYLVMTEDSIWKRLCCGSEFGFAAMHYKFACSISSDTSYFDTSIDEYDTVEPLKGLPTPATLQLLQKDHHLLWSHMFCTRPRIRFNGCYISTVNYTRPGASSPTQVSWNTPVHIVTYYRYLRFFRDGSVISLLTTSEPIEVVSLLTKEQLRSTVPSVMQYALRGRWRLSSVEEGGEGDIHIETEGVDAKYTYKMHLALRNSSSRPGSTKNNKMLWRGFWSYNRLTDDWAEFGLRNDRAFFWSRVKSYGMGE
ncbi:MAG: hypothetical protein M1834_006116 [Cirrosporium novae-zelandiae]|nr:MAG: hypothetical protein M1834_006116 [Cirrosporium novae-zelandiae]